MTRSGRQAPRASSGLAGELGRLLQLISSSASLRLDQVFSFSGTGLRRRRLQAALFIIVVFLVGFGLEWVAGWKAGTMTAIPEPPGALGAIALVIALRTLLILGIATSLALHVAGLFVADIFELKDVRIAWRFVSRLASGAPLDVLRLREGRLAENDRNSPLIQIGGPGRVIVESDTAALFERPDGTPHVVGASEPTHRGDSAATAILDGFERLREPVISLRDQYIGNPSGESLTVIGRSLDGLPISVTDVRGVFSVRREGTATDGPGSGPISFPFRARDIENLIYRQTVKVLATGEHASDIPGDWTTGMHALIRESLREFMGQNRLTEFLAGAGRHEAERSEYHADTILAKTLEVASEAPAMQSEATNTGRFRPRTELSAKFRKYGSEFSTHAQELGMELQWIGVGTWKIPDESSELTVSAKHIEAWRMNRENSSRLESDALETVARQALLEHKLSLIQDVPLASSARNKERYSDRIILMEYLLQDFWNQMGDALDIHYRAGAPSEDLDELEESVSRLEDLLRVSRMGDVLGGGMTSRIHRRQDWDRTMEGPPAPTTRAEALQYQALLSKLKGDHRVAEAMLANEKRRHAELSREQLIARIVERFERYGR